MKSQVDASTVSAGAFFADSRLLVPDFQRKYSWTTDEQVEDFWSDLSRGIGKGEYFLGLVILSDLSGSRREVVDGQQRLVTLTILANALRLAAMKLGRRLVAESIRTDFLYSMDFETEKQVPRILLTDADDKADLRVLLSSSVEAEAGLRPGSAIHNAHQYLARELESDLARHDNSALRVGQWTEFITKNVTFAVFMHPNRAAAFRVYEVINTRGKDLTPTELIKAYLIGSSGSTNRDSTHRRWKALEEQLDSVGAQDQLTTFVRHVVTLEHGYITPRDLYQTVSNNYQEEAGVSTLLDRLEQRLATYVQMIDPGSDVESSEKRTQALTIADALALTRFRPIMLVASDDELADDRFEQILRILVPGAITGRFSTGSIEAQFARAARRINQGGDWETELHRLSGLKPSREEFLLRLERGLNKQQAHVLRSAYILRQALPSLSGFPHQVRPRNAENWPLFGDEDYREFGGLIANWVLTDIERRPQGTRTPEAVEAKLIPHRIQHERHNEIDMAAWSADSVRQRSAEIAGAIAELWYGDR